MEEIRDEEQFAVPGRASSTYISTTIWEVKTEIPNGDFPVEGSVKNKLSICLRLTAALLTISGLAFAHHGSIVSYDIHKIVTMEGTVTEFQWRNPHVYVMYDVKDAQGQRRKLGSRDPLSDRLRKRGRLDEVDAQTRRQDHDFRFSLQDRHAARAAGENRVQRQSDHRRYGTRSAGRPVNSGTQRVHELMRHRGTDSAHGTPKGAARCEII